MPRGLWGEPLWTLRLPKAFRAARPSQGKPLISEQHAGLGSIPTASSLGKASFSRVCLPIPVLRTGSSHPQSIRLSITPLRGWESGRLPCCRSCVPLPPQWWHERLRPRVYTHMCMCIMYACTLSVTKSCPTLCDRTDSSPARLLCLWDFSGKNTGVGCHFLLQGIFLTQGSNPCLLHLLH